MCVTRRVIQCMNKSGLVARSSDAASKRKPKRKKQTTVRRALRQNQKKCTERPRAPAQCQQKIPRLI
ncbi:hypothetical protein PVAP13_1KG345505 [Panicum virgatum]|uniref:Uncharacterized protein n=1 Tax=Panicum virgatum TaxID=38727 RepID=A0A8T0XCT7_PANVG|nr:hypothetical protein PVAP13_1KG345505 [Panicum virgatum]